MHFINYYILHCIRSTVKNMNKQKRTKQLSVNVNIDDAEVEKCFIKSTRIYRNDMINVQYYKSYLKHILGENNTEDLHEIFVKLDFMKEYVDFRISATTPQDKDLVICALKQNNYLSKNTTRPDVVIKLFPVEYNGKMAVIKTYMYDGSSQYIKWGLEQNIKNEILFQNYAKTLNKKFDFISPELYSWGQLYSYKPLLGDDSQKFKVMFLIMEYIPFMTLKQVSCTNDNITTIYEKIDLLDHELKTNLLHHNDLHSSNILISTSPLPQICILDFGESAFGTRKRIQ